MPVGSLFRQSFFSPPRDGDWSKRSLENKTMQLLTFNRTHQGGNFLIPLAFYLNTLDNTDTTHLSYMSPQKKEILLYDLQNTMILILAQMQYEKTHQKTENISDYNSRLTQCAQLINAILYPNHRLCDSPVLYLVLSLGAEFGSELVSNSLTKPLQGTIRRFNEKRLYWVWGSALIKLMMDLLPSNLSHINQARAYINIPDLYTGFISWALYYFRLGLNLALLLKHTIPHPWMSEEEKAESWTHRLSTQWNLRKYPILNDAVWATGNLLCYFWLCGSGIAGVWGDLLTVGLLIFDVSLAAWEYQEQKVLYDKERVELIDAQNEIISEINAISLIDRQHPSIEYKKNIKELTLRLNTLERMQRRCENEWIYQKISLFSGVIYALGLMLAFLLAALPFFPGSLPLFAMSALGTMLCFALTVISNGVKGAIGIYRSQVSLTEAKTGAKKQLADLDLALTIDEKKDLFLEIKKLRLEIEYQENNISLQTAQLTRLFLIQLIVPAAVLSSLVFLSAGLALIALAVGVGLALASDQWVNERFGFERKKINDFYQNEFDDFIAAPAC